MAINLEKGERIHLDRKMHDLSRVTIGLGWNVKKGKKGLIGSLLGAGGPDFDLDAIAFLMDKNGHVLNLGIQRDMGGGRLEGFFKSDVIFYNNLEHPSGAIWHTGDERRGHLGEDDDEQIVVRLSQLPEEYHRIMFLVTIYKGEQREQHFGMLSEAYIHALDANNEEIVRFNLAATPEYEDNASLIFAEVTRRGDDWDFCALGTPEKTDRFVDILRKYLPPKP